MNLLQTMRDLTRTCLAYYIFLTEQKLDKDESELFVANKKIIKKLHEPEEFKLIIKAPGFKKEHDKTIDELFKKYLKDSMDELIEKTLPLLKENKLTFYELGYEEPYPSYCFTDSETGVSLQLTLGAYFGADMEHFLLRGLYSIVYETTGESQNG